MLSAEDKRRGVTTAAAVVVFSVVWGYNWVVMKKALAFASPVDFGALRTLLGALALFAVLVYRRRPRWPLAPGLTVLIGVLQTGVFTTLVNASLMLGGASRTAVLTYTMPFWTLLLSRVLLGERMARHNWPAIIIAFGGLIAIFVAAPRNLDAGLPALLAVLAGLTWALAAILVKRLRQRTAPDLLSLTAWQMLFGALALCLAAVIWPSRTIDWSPYFILALAYNALLATALAWLLWLFVLERLSAGMAGMVTLSIPVIGVASAALELGERPTPAEAAGMLAIGLGLTLLAVGGMRRRAP